MSCKRVLQRSHSQLKGSRLARQRRGGLLGSPLRHCGSVYFSVDMNNRRSKTTLRRCCGFFNVGIRPGDPYATVCSICLKKVKSTSEQKSATILASSPVFDRPLVSRCPRAPAGARPVRGHAAGRGHQERGLRRRRPRRRHRPRRRRACWLRRRACWLRTNVVNTNWAAAKSNEF